MYISLRRIIIYFLIIHFTEPSFKYIIATLDLNCFAMWIHCIGATFSIHLNLGLYPWLPFNSQNEKQYAYVPGAENTTATINKMVAKKSHDLFIFRKRVCLHKIMYKIEKQLCYTHIYLITLKIK